MLLMASDWNSQVAHAFHDLAELNLIVDFGMERSHDETAFADPIHLHLIVGFGMNRGQDDITFADPTDFI